MSPQGVSEGSTTGLARPPGSLDHRARSTTGLALGAGALAGVLVADGIYGLTVVDSSTSPVYWTLCLAAGAVLVTATAVRLRTPAAAAVVVLSAVAATGVLSLGYAALNAIA
nr:DUF6518 family protein [Nocardioides ferulae]